MRVVIFHRGEGKPDSPSLSKIRQHCERSGDSVTAKFISENGKRLSSKELANLFEKMQARFVSGDLKPSVIMTPDATHIADDLETLALRILILQRLNCEVRCMEGDYTDPLQSGAMKLQLGVGAGKRNTQGIRSAFIKKAAQGQVLGRTPYGYSKGVDGKLTVNKNEVEPVITMFSKSAKGEGLRKIGRYLRENGYKTRSGKYWSQVAISNLIKNKVYLGTYLRCNTHIVGNHEPLVDMDVFKEANSSLKERRIEVSSNRTKNAYPLSGLLKCSYCSGAMVGNTRYRKWHNKSGAPQKRAYYYYRCSNYDCSLGVALNVNKVHKEVTKWISKHKVTALSESRKVYQAHVLNHEDSGTDSLARSFMSGYQAVLEGKTNLDNIKNLIVELITQENSSKSTTKHNLVKIGTIVSKAKQMDGSLECSAALRSIIGEIKVSKKNLEIKSLATSKA